MEQSSKLSASVTAAAVVAMAGSLLLFLGTVAALAGILLSPRPNGAQELQPFVKTFSIGMTVVMICVSIFGFATGIGLLRLKRWARISAIVWSGFCVFFGVIGIPIALKMPFGQMPDVAATPHGVLSFVRLFLLIFYGVPLIVGVWWLILFNRKTTKAKFTGEATSPNAATNLGPRCPIAITIIAWFFIGSAANVLIYPFFPIRMPLILFGHIFPDVSMSSFLIVCCLLLLVAGISLLKLQRWSYSFTIGLQLFILTNGVLTVLNPNFERMMADVMTQTNKVMHVSGDSLAPPNSTFFVHVGVYGGLLFSAAILVLLFYYREEFLQAAEAKKLQQPSRAN